MLIMRHHPRGRGFRLFAIIIAAIFVLGLLLVLTPRAAASQQMQAEPATRSSALLLLRGADTLVVERIQRSATTVTAILGGAGMPRVTMTYTLSPDHLMPLMTFTAHAPGAAPDAAPIQTGSLALSADSARLSLTIGSAPPRALYAAVPAGTLPWVNNDFVTAEQAVRRARAQGVTQLTVPLFALSNGQVVNSTVELMGADSARFTIMGMVITLAVDAFGNVTGGEIAQQGIRIVALEGPAAAAISFGRPNYSAPAGAPYRAEEVTVRTPAGHSLAGTLTLPSAPAGARMPAVVTITGSGAQDRDEFIPLAGGVRIFRQVADTLSRRGIAVLRLDDRGVGASGGDPNATSADFADDIRAAVAYLRTRPEIDPARIALVGHSEGGMIAPMVAVSDPQLAAIALMAGTAYTGRRIIDYQYENLVRGNPAVAAASADSVLKAMRASFDSTEAKKPWMKYFLEYDPLPTARRVKQPVLILQGETDQQVRVEEARALDRVMRASGNRRVTMKLFPDRNHLFLMDPSGHPSGYARLTNNTVDADVLGTLADWLATTLGTK